MIIFFQKQKNDDGYSCWGGSHDIKDMSQAMSNWQRALCAAENDIGIFLNQLFFICNITFMIVC